VRAVRFLVEHRYGLRPISAPLDITQVGGEPFRQLVVPQFEFGTLLDLAPLFHITGSGYAPGVGG